MYSYTCQYLLKSGNSPNAHSLYKNETILTAVFSFDKEVPKIQRAEVKKRCSLKETTKKLSPGHYSIEESPLDAFMKRTLLYQPNWSELLIGKQYYGKKEFVTITPFLWGLGFHLKSEASGPMPLEEMISLEAINEFVLTGKFSPKVEKQLQEQQA